MPPAGFTSRLFVTGALTFVLIGILGGAYGVSLPALTRDFGLAEGQAAWMLTASLLGGMGAVLAQAMGVPGLTLRLGLCLLALGAAGIAIEWTWATVLIGTVVAGSGFGLIAVIINREFLRGFGDRGPGMVGLIIAPLVYLAAGRSVTMLFAGIALFAVALVPLALPPSGAPPPRGFLPLNPRRLGFLGLNTVSGMIEASVSGLGVTALIALGQDEGSAARLASGFFATYLVGRLSLYWLSRWFRPEHLFLAGSVGTVAVCFLAVMGWPGLAHVLAGATIGIMFPPYYVWASARLGEDARTGGAILVFGMGGGAVGPVIFGAVLAATGGIGGLYAMAALMAAGLAAAIALTIRALRQ
jgi:MFS transporter, FHS family, glucose/mannose:H+ symporter